MKEAGIEKSKNFVEKTTPSGYPKKFSEKIRLLFVPFWPFFGEKMSVVTLTGSESKCHLAYTGAMIPRVSNMQRVWSHHFPVLSFVKSKDVFFQFRTTFSSLAAFLGTTPTFFEK